MMLSQPMFTHMEGWLTLDLRLCFSNTFLLCQFTHKIAENSEIIQTPSIIYACSKCDAELRSVDQLEVHIEQNHQMDEKEEEDRITWCEICEIRGLYFFLY